MITNTSKPVGIRVAPRSTLHIRDIASKARELLSITEPCADAIDILEFKLPVFGVIYEFCDAEELGDDHGLTIPDQLTIKIREDVYNGACNGSGRDRFTIFHEIGHLLMHAGVPFARSQTASNDHDWFEDSEWQANTFAAEFMMPIEHIVKKCKTPGDVSRLFNSSYDAAELRMKKLKKQGII